MLGKGKIKSNYRVREKNSFLKNKALEVGLETKMEKFMEMIWWKALANRGKEGYKGLIQVGPILWRTENGLLRNQYLIGGLSL